MIDVSAAWHGPPASINAAARPNQRARVGICLPSGPKSTTNRRAGGVQPVLQCERAQAYEHVSLLVARIGGDKKPNVGIGQQLRIDCRRGGLQFLLAGALDDTPVGPPGGSIEILRQMIDQGSSPLRRRPVISRPVLDKIPGQQPVALITEGVKQPIDRPERVMKPGAEIDPKANALDEVMPPVGFVYDDAGSKDNRGRLGAKVRAVDIDRCDARQNAAAGAREGNLGERAKLRFVESAVGLDINLRELPDLVPLLHGEDSDGKYLDVNALQLRPPLIRPVVPSCWRAWLHLASLVQERGDLPGYPLEFLDLAVVGDEVRE